MDVFVAVEGMLRTPVGVPFLATETFPPLPPPSAAVVIVYLKLPTVKEVCANRFPEESNKNTPTRNKLIFRISDKFSLMIS